MAEKNRWYKDAVVYRVRDIREDSGEECRPATFREIFEQLDYIQSLNATVLWLPEILSRENYEEAALERGGTRAFLQLLSAVHARGMRLIIDINYQSTHISHDWFSRSCAGETAYNNYYIWRKAGKDGTLPNNWDSLSGGKAWTYSEEKKNYYLHILDESHPDLNHENPSVRAEIRRTLQLWLDLGVDGFYEKNLSFLSKSHKLPEGIPVVKGYCGIRHYLNGARMHEFLSEIHQGFQNYDSVFIGETQLAKTKLAKEYVQENTNELTLLSVPQCCADTIGFRKDSLQGLPLIARKFIWSRWQNVMDKSSWSFQCPFSQNSAQLTEGRIHFPTEALKSLCCAFMFRRGTPVIVQGYEINENENSVNDPESLLNFYREAAYYHRTLSVVRYGGYSQIMPWSRNLFVYRRCSKVQDLLVICSFTAQAAKFKAPREYDLRKGELLLSSHSDYIENNGFVTQPYETRVYLFQKRRTELRIDQPADKKT